jgi:hypothetical protein
VEGGWRRRGGCLRGIRGKKIARRDDLRADRRRRRADPQERRKNMDKILVLLSFFLIVENRE